MSAYPDEIARAPRVGPALNEVRSWAVGAGTAPAPRSVSRSHHWRQEPDEFGVLPPGFVLPSGHRHGSEAWRHRRRVLRRHLYQLRAVTVLLTSVSAGAFALDRPVAGVLGSALAFVCLRAAAETRAEL